MILKQVLPSFYIKKHRLHTH
uniref:Uncharacterized protein n=1 Tax=Lepeophtheirus salmonis TaxID=72036 RepID=A0A0K2UW30_LEPSM